MKKYTLRYWQKTAHNTIIRITKRLSDEKEMTVSVYEVLNDPSVVCIETEADGIITVHKAWTEN